MLCSLDDERHEQGGERSNTGPIQGFSIEYEPSDAITGDQYERSWMRSPNACLCQEPSKVGGHLSKNDGRLRTFHIRTAVPLADRIPSENDAGI